MARSGAGTCYSESVQRQQVCDVGGLGGLCALPSAGPVRVEICLYTHVSFVFGREDGQLFLHAGGRRRIGRLAASNRLGSAAFDRLSTLAVLHLESLLLRLLLLQLTRLQLQRQQTTHRS